MRVVATGGATGGPPTAAERGGGITLAGRGVPLDIGGVIQGAVGGATLGSSTLLPGGGGGGGTGAVE